MKTKVKFFLFLIILLAAFLRIYKLDQVPPSLNWDEADAGYNAYTIANWGRDEWGQFLPLTFTSFRDDKHPVHIYLTALFVKLFGLSDFTVRFPSALIGVLSILVIFYLVRIIFKDDLTALLSALFLSVSPYHIQFSRGLWEVNFALFFFLLGFLLFHMAIQKKGWLINVSFLSFGISFLAYHSSKIVVPVIVLILIVLYFKDLKKLSLNFYTGIFILLIFIFLLLTNPRLVGFARIKQTEFEPKDIEETQIYQKTKNSVLGLGEIILEQYLAHFTPQYLFISGDQSPRNSVKTQGEFYKTDALFILIGLFYLLKKRSKITLILFSWLLISAMPASLVKGAPSTTRAIFMLGILNIIAAVGAGTVLNWFKGKTRYMALSFILLLLTIQIYSYLNYYFNIYPKKDAIEWQYGMRQISDFVKDHEEYNQVFVTDIRAQPYIFFLYYLKMPLGEYLNNVMYNNAKESKSYNTVSYFGGYYIGSDGKQRRVNLYFGGWNPIESTPDKGTLYVISPSQYDGLKYRSLFDVKKIIYFPDKGVAFFIVSAK